MALEPLVGEVILHSFAIFFLLPPSSICVSGSTIAINSIASIGSVADSLKKIMLRCCR